MFQAAIAPGMSSAQMVLTIPSERTSRYVGIRPPEKNIVNTISTITNLRPTSRFLDSG